MRSSNNTAAQRSSHSVPDSVIFLSAPFPPVKRGRGPFKVRPSLPQNFPVSALFDPGRLAKLAAELEVGPGGMTGKKRSPIRSAIGEQRRSFQ